MDIISLPFILSTSASVIIFYLLGNKYRIGFLTVISCGFIAMYNYYFLIYVIALALLNYIIGIKLSAAKHKIELFRLGIIINILQLFILKYATFGIDPILRLFNSNFHVANLSVFIMPIGISYFTLQGIGYLINVKMGWEKPEARFLNFLLYIIFYPKFLSGPIERSNHFLPQLNINKLFNEQHVTEGLRIALFGFFKKIVIANRLAPYISSAYTDPNSVDGMSLWILLVLQPLYLYFDFSGYTDIARGIAKMFGINILPNFNRPFFSENITMFWKRFHISLSSWFNDYVFKQVSFKYRKWGVYSSVYALFLTWILFGIWHGAGWNFMILGLIQALAIIYEFFTKRIRYRVFSIFPGILKTWLSRIITYIFFASSLVFFFAPDLHTALEYFINLTEINGSPGMFIPVSVQPYLVPLFIFILFLIELLQNDFAQRHAKVERFWYRNEMRIIRWAVYSLLITLIIATNSGVEQFIYASF